MSKQIFVVTACIVAATSIVAPAAAQVQTGWEAGAGIRLGSQESQRTLGGALKLDRRFGTLEASGGVRDTGRTWLVDAGARALVASPAWHGFQASAVGDVRHAADAGRLPIAFRSAPFGMLDRSAVASSWVTSGATRLSYARGTRGAWLGLDVAGKTAADSTPGGARFGVGLWQQLRDAIVSVRVGSRSALLGGRSATFQTYQVPIIRADTTRLGGDSVRIRYDTTGFLDRVRGDSGVASQLRRWTEAELQLAWARGRYTLDGVIGARPRVGARVSADSFRVGLSSIVWAHASGSMALGRRVAVVAGIGVVPTTDASPVARNRFATLGVRLAPPSLRRARLPEGVRPVASAFDVKAAASGEYVISVRAPGARTVELSGDFTNWEPVALRQVATGRWEATVRMRPGTHRCNVRVDGERWDAPPGTTAVDDDFNGRVGLIVAP